MFISQGVKNKTYIVKYNCSDGVIGTEQLKVGAGGIKFNSIYSLFWVKKEKKSLLLLSSEKTAAP